MAIKQCSCQHLYQDSVYGPGNRVMNKMTKSEGYRCTVCGKDSFSGGDKKKKK